MDRETYNYQFIAGNLALDLVNTVAYRADPAKKKDHLRSAEDLYRWASQAKLADLTEIGTAALAGTAALRRIRAVREKLFEIFHAIAGGDPVPADTLTRVGHAFQDCCSRRYLAKKGADVSWTWGPSTRPADYLLYPVLTAAIDLLTSDMRDLVSQCDDAGCGWLFLDRSNARTRRWCSMADCGNRNKARKYYQRAG